MPYRIFIIALCVVLLSASSIHAEDNSHLIVAWLDNDEFMVWQSGEPAPHPIASKFTTGYPRQVLISSDAHYVAVTVINPGSLWIAAPSENNLIEVVPNQVLPAPNGDPKSATIVNLQRGANSTFYFTTLDQPSHYAFHNEDLWFVDAASATRTYKQLLPSSQAGSFNLSPNHQHIAIVQSGTYGAVDGKISLVDGAGQNRKAVMNFSAVSSGSDDSFYLPTFWEADSAAFNIAIPHKDLVYNDNSALTTLWHVAVDGTETQLGSVQATVFGLPQWSDDGKTITYMRRLGDISTNQFELMIASGDGSNPITYANGTAGEIGVPHWLPNSNQFVYSQGELGDYWLGQAGQPPQALPGKIFNPQFIDSSTYVFATAPGDTFELRYAHIGDASSTLIATVHNVVPVFDALLVP